MAKVAVVTGGTRGIGFGIVKLLVKNSFVVYAVGTREKEDDYPEFSTFKKNNKNCKYICANIHNEKDRINIVNTVMQNESGIDLLVNNAGVAPKERNDILKITEESMDFVLGVNLKGTFFLTQLVANKMIEQVEKGKEPGMIVNIGSISSDTSSVNRGEYCISKAGVSMITKLFADRLASYGINVYEIRPGIIESDMTSTVKEKYDDLIFNRGILPIKRWGKPEDVAKAVLAFALGLFPYSTGTVVDIDGGFHIKRL
ncbi:MAG: 3-ketoacyl-ACP reductase [Clostridiaceae bacterium]|nr:3-ketoacyl-ACP reductase [Clostridiaceae bacterium]